MTRHRYLCACMGLAVGLVAGGVYAADLTWDPTGGGSSDGAGTWLNTGVWWDGGANVDWNSGTPDNATIGNGGSGGSIVVGVATANNVSFGSFGGTYKLTKLTSSDYTFLEVTGGITSTTDSGNITIEKRISGTGGITVTTGPGNLFLLDNPDTYPSTYTGKTLVTSNSIFQSGAAWQRQESIPGALGNGSTGCNLDLNDGIFVAMWNLYRSLGTGPGQMQLTGGRCGVTMKTDPRSEWIFGNDTNFELIWGTNTFNPSILVLNDASVVSPGEDCRLRNKIDLNGTNRTVEVGSSSYYSSIEGVIRNSGATEAGLVKIGAGQLKLTAANTYDGKTVISNGTITVDDLANEGEASPLGAPTGAAATIDMYPGTLFNFAPPDIRDVYFTTDRTINLAGTGSGTVEVKINSNDKWSSFGSVTGTGTGPRTLKLTVDGGGAGDRSRIRFTGPISDTSDNMVSLVAVYGSAGGANGQVILEGTNTFSGSITMSGPSKLHHRFVIDGSGQLGSGSYTNTISIGGYCVFYYLSSATQELSGAISGAGVLNLDEVSALLTLSASNTYSGGTTISAGTLYASATNALGEGDVTVSGGMLVLDSSNGISSSVTLTLPSETATNLTVNADNTVAALYINGIRKPNGSYTAAGAGSGWMTGSGTLIVGAASLYWDRNGTSAGAGTTPNGVWDTATTANWNVNADGTTAVTTWGSGLAAVFSAGSDASGDYTVTVSGTSDINGMNFEDGNTTITNGALQLIAPGNIYVASAGQTATVATAISEDGSSRALDKTGAGALTLSGANTYTGPTTVGEGTLRAGVATVAGVSGALGNDSAVTMVDNATALIDLAGYDTQIASLSGGGSSGGNVSLGAATLTLGVDNLGTTYAGSIYGSGGLVKEGSGTLILKGTNGFTGDIAINGGSLRVGDGNSAGDLNGGTYTGNVSIANGLQLVIGSTVAHTLSGIISGEGGVRTSGNGRLTLTAENTYQGQTRIESYGPGNPSLSVSSFNSVFTDAGLGTVHLPSSSMGAPTNAADGVIFLGANAQRNFTLVYTGPGETTDRGIQILFNASRDRTIDASGSGPLKFVTPFVMSGAGGDVVLTGSGSGEIAANIPVNGPTGVEKTGSGTWILSGVNTYTGVTTVTSGTLIANATNALGFGPVAVNGGQLIANAPSSLGDLAVTVNSGGTLVFAGVDCMSDTNSLVVNAGGVIQLNAGVKEKIGSLWLGGVEQSAGKWGSTSSPADNQNDTYFSGTGMLYVAVSVPSLINQPESDLTSTSVTFNATLASSVDEYDVLVYWGTNNGGEVATNWTYSAPVGSWTNVAYTNISCSANGLTPATVYYFAFRSTNSSDSIWASPSISFTTLDAPLVDNGSGPTSVSATSATLRGELTNGTLASAWICWGTNDAGTASTGDWVNVLSAGTATQGVEFSETAMGMATNATYWYRCFVSNTSGTAWSDDAQSFSGTPVGAVGGGGGASIAIYREAAGGDNISASLGDMTWDTTVREDAAYQLQADNKSIRMLEDGRYLCLYNLGIYRANRFEVAVGLNLAASSLGARGKGSGYTRDGTGPNAWISAAAIFDANADDDLILQYQRTSDADSTLLANASGITLVKLDDTQAFLAVEEVGGGEAHNTDLNFAPITFDTDTVASTDTSTLDHSTSADTDQILIKAPGKYLITYSLEFEDTATTRRNGNTRLALDGVEIEATRVSGYSRYDNSCADPVCSWVGVIDVASASPGTPAVLRLEACSEGANTAADLLSQQGALCITKLPASVKILRSVLSADLAVEGAEFAVDWPTPDEIDEDVFTYNAGTPSRIEVDTDDDYLFLSSFYTYRASNTTRSVPRWRWRRNGTTTYDYGIFSQYNRGDEGTEDTWSGGQAGGFVGTNMSASDYIEILAVDDYNTGDVNNDYKADMTGIQAIQISSVVAAGGTIANLAPTNITGSDAVLNASISVAGNTNYAVYVHFGTGDGGTNFVWGDGYFSAGSYTNSTSTNETYSISYPKAGLKGGTSYYYTFRASNDAGNAWASPSWMFTTGPPTGAGSVFMFK